MTAPVTLSDESVGAIAERVAELLRVEGIGTAVPNHRPPDLIDAAEVARRLGISRATVYERADDLGAIRISDGPKARIRFDPDRVAEALAIESRPNPSPTPRRRSAPPRRSSVPLLPVGRKSRG